MIPSARLFVRNDVGLVGHLVLLDARAIANKMISVIIARAEELSGPPLLYIDLRGMPFTFGDDNSAPNIVNEAPELPPQVGGWSGCCATPSLAFLVPIDNTLIVTPYCERR